MKPVPGRECGGCAACCTDLHIKAPGFQKLAGVRCINLAADCKCTIYEARPQVCADFECGWRLMAALGDDWRPDRCGIILIPKTKDNPPGYHADSGVQIMLLRRDAIYRKELPGLIAAWVNARAPVFLTLASPVGFLAKTAFLNESVAGAVRRQDRAGLVGALEEVLEELQGRKLEPADFAAMPG
jgi:uncharacterized cysteine cluster protein YcgN (CxxCxxCC family)